MNGDKKERQLPHRLLGSRLRRLRESARQSIAEVSGAVEINPEQLKSYESGQSLPDEEILLLLISHFNLKDEEALKVWKLAKYDDVGQFNSSQGQQRIVATPEDIKISYTDLVHVSVNNHGVVMNFMQSNGPSGQSMIISRVGMSREHAQSIIQLLQQSLVNIEPKSLPAPDQEKT